MSYEIKSFIFIIDYLHQTSHNAAIRQNLLKWETLYTSNFYECPSFKKNEKWTPLKNLKKNHSCNFVFHDGDKKCIVVS